MIRVIIPAFDEAGSLQTLLPRLPVTVTGHDVAPLVVSDGSRDNTVSVSQDLGIPVIDLQPNQGKGTALRAALEEIAELPTDIVIFMDADGQHDPADIERLVAPIVGGHCDIAVGSRYANDDHRGNTPFNRYFVRSTTVALLHRILGRRFTDPYCGFRAFTKDALDTVEFCGTRYEGELEVLFDSCRLGLDVVEVPIARIYGPGTSKMAADGGRLIGRVRVIRQYASTILRKTRQLKAARNQSATRDKEGSL